MMLKQSERLKHSQQFVSNPGKRMKEIFHGEIQEDGSIDLVSDGFEDVYRKIQADAVGCDLPSIVARATSGDPTAFRDGGFYGDVVGMPKTYAEILNTVNDGQRQFDALPLEIRNKFDNSFEKWFATLGNKEWLDAMGISKKETDIPLEPVVDVKESEVKE